MFMYYYIIRAEGFVTLLVIICVVRTQYIICLWALRWREMFGHRWAVIEVSRKSMLRIDLIQNGRSSLSVIDAKHVYLVLVYVHGSDIYDTRRNYIKELRVWKNHSTRRKDKNDYLHYVCSTCGGYNIISYFDSNAIECGQFKIRLNVTKLQTLWKQTIWWYIILCDKSKKTLRK